MEREGKFLIKRHAFGARSDVGGALGWLDEGTLMYPVGKAVALHTISANNQRFLEASYQSSGTTALAVSANKKFVAVAEGGDNPQIQIIDTTTRKRRKVLTVSDLGSDRFTAMAFSADGRHLVTQGGAPSWNLFYWNWERSKPLASVALGSASPDRSRAGGTGFGANAGGPLVTGVAICPSDALTVTVSGVGFMRYYRYTDGLLHPQASCGYPQERQETFLVHAWLDGERLVASTARSGSLILVDRGRFMGHIPSPHSVANYTAANAGAFAVTAIAASRKGFVVGCSNGAVSVYERNPDAMMGGVAVSAAVGPGGRGGEVADLEDGGAPVTHAYERLCTLQVPEREPGEPVDLAPPRDPLRVGLAGGSGGGAGAWGPGATASSALAAGASFESVGQASATLNRKGKPRRFHVRLPATADGGGGAGGGVAAAAGAAVGSPATTAGSGEVASSAGAGSRQLTALPKAGEAGRVGRAVETGADAQDAVTSASGSGLGAAGGFAKAGHGIASLALDQGDERLAVLTNAGKIYALDYRQHWAQVQRDVEAGRAATAALKDSHHRLSTAADGPGRNFGASGDAGAVEDSTGGIATAAAAVPAGVSAAISASSAAGAAVPIFQPVCEPFHTGSINGLACSVRKPFLLTSGSDHSVRLWNTLTHRMEMCVFFKEEPGAVAVHPSGLMAVICFPDCVRVMSVLWNSLRDRRTINFRNATDVAFSHGGHFFSISHGNLVDVYHSATCEPHGQLRGHPQRVKDLKWCSTSPYPTDNRLVTCSLDGMIMYWNSQDVRKEAEHSDNKRFQYLSVAADDRHVWAVGAPTSATAMEVQWKVTLREMDRHVLGSSTATTDDYEFTDMSISSLIIAPHQRILFGGGDDGSLKAMTLPLAAGVQEAPLSAHGSRITRMAVSYDESTLFTAGADGSIFVWEIREDATRGGAPAAVSGGEAVGATRTGAAAGGGKLGFEYGTNEVLVTQQELEEQRAEMESLQQQVDKLRTDLDSEEKRRNHEQGTRMRERMEEHKGDAAALAAEYASLWNSKAEQERSFVAIKLEKEAEAAHTMESAERAHQAEVQELEELCNTLQHTLEKEQTQHEDELQKLQVRIEEDEKADGERYTDLVSQRREVLEKLARQAARAKQTNKETLHQLELDTDAESQAVGDRHGRELGALRERFLHMKGEGAIMRKNAARMEREIDVRVGEIRLLDSARAALATQLSELNQCMAQLHQDIDERDVVIGEKEKSIYALKKHNQELEKHKFVLDHRIRQLKAQMEPKQREIVQHNQRIRTRNGELEALHENNLTLRRSIEELKKELADQLQQANQLRGAIKDLGTYQESFMRDAGGIASALQDPQKLRQVIEDLYVKHVVRRGGQRVAAAGPQIRQEFHEQLEYLSTSVGALRRKVKADQEDHRRAVSSMMTENLALIKEIQVLRAEIQELRSTVAAEDAARRARGGQRGGSFGASGSSHHVGRASSVRGQAMPDASVVEGGDAPQRLRSPSPGGSVAAETASAVAAANDEGADEVAAGSSVARTPPLFNPMPSSSGPHPKPPTSSVGGGSRSRPQRSGASVSVVGSRRDEKSRSRPDPPKAIEVNRTELRALRAYIGALEKALASGQRPGSNGQRLPPLENSA